MVNSSLLTSSRRSPCFTITSDWFEWQRSQKTNSILGSPVSVHGLPHYQLYFTDLRMISLSFYSIVGENLEKVTRGRMTRLAVIQVASDINRRAQIPNAFTRLAHARKNLTRPQLCKARGICLT